MDAIPVASPAKPNAGQTVAATLAEAGHTLEGSEADLVILPLRLAFETKQSKLVEPALDCLHVRLSRLHSWRSPRCCQGYFGVFIRFHQVVAGDDFVVWVLVSMDR